MFQANIRHEFLFLKMKFEFTNIRLYISDK